MLRTYETYRDTRPERPRPVVLIGAGGIVRDAHLPAYRRAGYPIASLCDRDRERAQALAAEHGVTQVHSSAAEAVAAAPADAVFDVALAPEQFAEVLEVLPDGSPVLLQKPFGATLQDARALLDICRRKRLLAAVNLQLRYAPYVTEARRLIDEGWIGELYDIDVRVVLETPWERFPSVVRHPRLEIAMHSIHYVDLVRSFLGNPASVSAVTVGHPAKDLASTRTSLLLHYGGTTRATVVTDHDHDFAPDHQEAHLHWEGTEGAVRATMGVLLDYPVGRPDVLEHVVRHDDRGWRRLPVSGTWFPDAFAGTMGALMRRAEGSSDSLPTSVEDVVDTMAVVEAAFAAAALGGVEPEYAVRPGATP